MKHLFITTIVIILGILLIPTINVQADNPGCNITSFTLSPSGPTYNLGDVIALEGKSTCGTVRFEIDQEPKSEIGSTSLSMNMNTTEFGAGQHDVCFVARGEGGWEKADRRCVKITIKENKPKCQITNFSYSPKKDVYTLGDVVDFSGQSTCGTVQYSVEGKTVSELGSTNLNYQFKTGEWGKETYTVCFIARGDGGWESADKRCGTIFVGTDPGLPPVYPDEPENGSGDSNQEGQDACKINNFNVNPQSANPGDVITLNGSGNCEEGGPRAVRFTIDGKVKDELGAPSLTATWNTSGYSNGTHRVCFQVVKYDWEYAVSQCLNVKLGQGTSGSEAGSATNCKGDHATFVEDLSIPDGTKVLPGEIFVKSWRIKNDGNCIWNRSYNFTSVQGDRMGGKDQNIPGTISPGQSIDISIQMQAPNEPGSIKARWGIMDPSKNLIKSTVFVSVEVENQSNNQSLSNNPQASSAQKKSLDILGYCKSRGYTGAYANDKDNARSWVCQKTGDLTFVNFDDACEFTNGEEFAKAVIQDEKNPNSWYCEQTRTTNNNSIIPQVYAADVNQVDLSTICHPQCVDYVKTKRPDSKDWAGGAGVAKNWFSKASNKPKFKIDGIEYYVFIREANEVPQVNDIAVWGGNCGLALEDGHVGIVSSVSGNTFRVNDSNAAGDCKTREPSNDIQIESCIHFISSPTSLKYIEDPNNSTIDIPSKEVSKEENNIHKFMCNSIFKFLFDCSNN